MSSKRENTAGQAHPYWYEWFVGLVEVVKLLNPDEGIAKVAFQVASIQGWDDVVVTHAEGRRLYQVKHTRGKNKLTFGSMVEVDKNGKSLLSNLFVGAKNSGLINPKDELVLYTNREDGSRWSTRKDGGQRPPLLVFWAWLSSELEKNPIGDISPPAEYSEAWFEWRGCFEGNEDDATNFLKNLRIRPKEDDLDGLELRIRANLATAFGVSEDQAAPLFDALCRGLRDWTTGHSGVGVETLLDVLTIETTPKDFAPAPPPPTPFFPSRLPVAEELQAELLDRSSPPVLFLTGEAGSGKTSAVSWLANRRTEKDFQGVIGIRFFCFEPIRPAQPFISPDASRVHPEELWFSLLAQLRRGLHGRLHELKVPIRDSFLSWSQARGHVLRLADILGGEFGRRFVISVDGIDHAARAAQLVPTQIAKFFASLPSPDEVEAKNIQMLIAGQPPEYYQGEYPVWLTSSHPKVRRFDLPKLKQDDIRCLLENSTTSIGHSQFDEAVRLIDESSQGNTLSVVFAVAEAESCNSLPEFERQLADRSLADGISEYYDSIWRHAIHDAGDLSCSLAGVISFARTAITATQLSRIFSAWQRPVPWWKKVLIGLSPLLAQRSSGHFIRHNDVRVFLASKFSGYGAAERQLVVSQIVGYLSGGSSDRLAAHLQLFDLLPLADRRDDAAHIFDVDWVLEGAALGLEVDQLRREGELAVAQLASVKSWSVVVSVSCALETLDRVGEYAEHYLDTKPSRTDLPPFLPSEASVCPIERWTSDNLHQLVWDAHELVRCGDHSRAKGLLCRWLDGLGIEQVVQSIPDLDSEFVDRLAKDSEPRLGDQARRSFEMLGSLSAKIDWKLWGNFTEKSSPAEVDAFFAFEKGFVNEISRASTDQSLSDITSRHKLIFLSNHELAIRNLAGAEAWGVVGELLESMIESRERYSDEFTLEASWYGLKAGVSADSPWLSGIHHEGELSLPTISNRHLDQNLNLLQFVNTARSIGWVRSSLDPGDVADIVFEAFDPPDESGVASALRLLFRAAAVVGKIEGYAKRSGWDSVSTLFTPDFIRQLLSALWGDVINRAPYRFGGRVLASELAETLVEICGQVGGDLDKAAYDAALPFAKKCVLGSRREAIWGVVKRHGSIDILRNWIDKYIGEKHGLVWTWEASEARETVEEFVPLAKSVGMDDVGGHAIERAKWLLVGYRNRKDYSFEQVREWFLDAARVDSSIWLTEGWRLWEACRICNDKDGDNRFESEILSEICAAAIRGSGIGGWWALISTTLTRKGERGWHYKVARLFIQGYVEALDQKMSLKDTEILPIWSIALSLSYWVENDDTSLLLDLREAMLRQVSDEAHARIQESMRSVGPVVLAEENEYGTKSTVSTDSATSADGILDENDWWREVNEISERPEESSRWAVASRLLAIARRRAVLHGIDELRSGLNIQINTHLRWAYGGRTPDPIPDLSASEAKTLDDVFVRLVNILLETVSVESTSAALEGMHNFVSHNPSIIEKLFDDISGEWPRRWLLNAAEVWAVLHPDHLARATNAIASVMGDGDLDLRLQAWVVLTRNAEVLGSEPPTFPLPSEAMRRSDFPDDRAGLLVIPAEMQGAVQFGNRFSTARNLVQYCGLFGFEFQCLEGVIAQSLSQLGGGDEGGRDRLAHGPHRYADFVYSPAHPEKAFGNAVISILSSRWCSDTHVADLCQAILPNDDAWIIRSRPKAISSINEWPVVSEYGPEKCSSHVRRDRMRAAAKSASIDDGWEVFAARVRDFSHDEDFDLRYWREEVEEGLLLSKASPPSCFGGRSFPWWIGEPLEPTRKNFVSGFFVGGRQRLHRSNFEIRPPVRWRDEFGWVPDPQDPLHWTKNGEVVAKYERLHGVLRQAPHEPKYRQPFIDRWVVKSSELQLVKKLIPLLQERERFEVYDFTT